MKFKFLYIFIILLSVAVCSCSGSKDEPEQPEQPETPGTRRTVICYMVSSNSLGSTSWQPGNDAKDMREMLEWSALNSLNDCNVVLVRIPRTDDMVSNPPVPVIERLVHDKFITERTYAPLSGQYGTDHKIMASLIADVKAMFPAKEYALVLWSHGTAWVTNSKTLPDTRAWGDDRGKTMSIPALAEALTSTGPWDIIYFDSCYAGTVEQIYELRHTAPYIIASTAEVHEDGMPYHLTLVPLTADSIDPTAVAKATFDYYDSLTGANRSCTIAVYNTAAFDDVAAATADIFASGASKPDGYNGICYSRAPIANIVYDMADYIHTLQGTTPAQISRWDAALARAVPYHAATPGMLGTKIDLSRFCGIGSYIVTSRYSAEYNGYTNLQWWTDVMCSGWFD